MIYERGLAGPPDEQTAYGWYRQAAANGSEAAVARLAAIEGRIAMPTPTAPAKDRPAARAAKPSAVDVAEIQRLLGQLAFKPGPADGKPGKATREAIRQYQQVAGLPVNGEPSQALLTHLRQVTNMMRSSGR
jgi:peptidoglycan hydrolase-like protein with peptidoglycan-binding domain